MMASGKDQYYSLLLPNLLTLYFANILISYGSISMAQGVYSQLCMVKHAHNFNMFELIELVEDMVVID